MYKTNIDKTPRDGYTLLELLLALAAVAILAFVVFRAYDSTRTAANVHAAASDIDIIRANLKNIYSGNDTGLSTTIANESHVFPPDMNDNVFTGGNVYNQWQGKVTLTAISGNEYELIYGNVPGTPCVMLALQAGQSASDETINGVDVFTNGIPDQHKIITNCNAAPMVSIALLEN